MSIHLNLSSLNRYSQSNREIFYYRSTEENRKRVSLKSIGKTNVSVTGKVKKKKWSFAISSTAALYPFPHLRIGSHIIFTSENNVILDIDEQHTLRRKFGFDWYNRDWLDTLLGMMLKIAGSEGTTIKIPIGGEKFLYIDAIPISCNSDFGYQEPIKEAVEND
jgi:hypothetical protein